MPAVITPEQVMAIAALAELELERAEIDMLASQLGEILAYASEVQSVDTTGVPPTAGIVTHHVVDRPDAVGPSLDRELAIATAPDAAQDAGLFRVPRVMG